MNRFLPSAAIVSMIFLHSAAHGQEIKGVALVQAQDPKRGSIPDMVYGYGIATPSSGSTLTASFQRDGRVSDIMVQVGDQFKMGDTLLDFGASPAAVVANEQAKTALTLAKNSLARANQHWQSRAAGGTPSPASTAPTPVEVAAASHADVPVYLAGLGTVQAFNTVTVKTRVDGQIQKVSFVEGQHVKAGDLLVQIDPRPYQASYDQVVAKKAQDEAQLANAKLDLDRYTALLKASAAPRQQADTQRALVTQLEATLRVDQGAIDAAKVQLDYTAIASPIDGVTGIRLVDQGNIVHATDTNGIVVVTQLQPISVVFSLPEDNLQSVSQAMAQGPVAVAALSRDGKTELDRGTLLLIDNMIDQTTGTIRLKATFPNPHNALWPGQFLNIRLLLQTEHNVLTVPSAAVGRGPDGLFTYVVKPDSTVEMRTVTVGQDTGAIAVIASGLAPGDRVVTAGQYRVQPGALVQIGTANSEMPPAKPGVAQQDVAQGAQQ